MGATELAALSTRLDCRPLIVRISTDLDISADLAWETVKKPETFLYVVRGVMGVRQLDDMPENWGEGLAVRVRLVFFHLIPAWTHEIRLVRIDEAAHEISTNERGGPVRHWNHRIRIQPQQASPLGVGEGSERCRYTDEIEIRAGPLTPLVWFCAHLFFRYRQSRWRKLARHLRSTQASGST
jgi:hypothetical protein